MSNQIKKDLSSLSTSLRSLQLTIADAKYALSNYVVVNVKDLKMVERGLSQLDSLRLQLISLSNVGHKTCESLQRDELLIQSLRNIKGSLGVNNENVKCLSNGYLKSRDCVLSHLKESVEKYSEDHYLESVGFDDEDEDDLDKTLTERVKDLMVSFPVGLISGYYQFYLDIKDKVDSRNKRNGKRSNTYQLEGDKDMEVMQSLCTLAEAYRDILLKNHTSIEELVGIIKGVHLCHLQFDSPLMENLSMLSMSTVIGVTLAIRELEEGY